MNNRTLFGKPLRDISLMCHTEEMSLDEFIEDIRDALLVYKTNIENLGKNNPSYFGNQKHYPELWVESFLAWHEIEQEDE